jgi:hypothetical protein
MASEAGSRSRASGSATMDDRRSRKRESDRKSQREHRERQKAYIRQLEESIKSLTSRQSAGERVALLFEEKKRLKERCDDLSSRLHRVRSILFNDQLTDQRVPTADTCPSDTDANAAAPRCREPSQDAHHAAVSPESTSGLLMLLDEQSSGTEAAMVDLFPPSLPGISNEFLGVSSSEPAELSSVMNFGQDDLVATQDRTEVVQRLEEAVASVPDPSWAICTARDSSDTTSTAHTQPPRYSPPLGTADRCLTAMLNEALCEHAMNNFDTSPPSLRNLLSNNPDILAFRLYHYITSYGSMPLHIFLGIFWVQYLILRVYF